MRPMRIYAYGDGDNAARIKIHGRVGESATNELGYPVRILCALLRRSRQRRNNAQSIWLMASSMAKSTRSGGWR